MAEDFLRNKKIRDMKNMIVKSPSVITREMNIKNLLIEILRDPRTRHVYVVDKENKLIGSVRLNDLMEILFPYTIMGDNLHTLSYMGQIRFKPKIVADVMNSEPVFAFDDMLVSDMIGVMRNEKINEMPILGKDKKIIGEINLMEVISYYLKYNR